MKSSKAPRPRALVTGASAGLGAEFARQLASRGLDLILIARRKDRLEDLAAELASNHGTESQVVLADLGASDAPEKLAAAIDENASSVEWLINNAGSGMPGKFLAMDWHAHEHYSRLMMTTPMALIHQRLPGMLRRGHGRIINVASLAGLVPSSAGHTLYGGTKAFLIRASEALNAEYSRRGVHVCATCPGFTRSEFHDVAGVRQQVSKMPTYMWQQPQPVVAASIRAVELGQPRVVTGVVNKFLAGALSAIPYRLAQRIVAGKARTFRRD